MIGGVAAGILLLIGGLAFWFLRRRRDDDDDEDEHEPVLDRGSRVRFDLIADVPPSAPEPVPEPMPPVVPPPAASPPVPPVPQPAAPAQAVFDLGAPPKRGAHAIFDLGAAPEEPQSPSPAPAEAPVAKTSEFLTSPIPARVVAEPVVAPAAMAARATLDIELRVKRAGTNLLSAAVDYDIVVRNLGEATAQDVQVDVRLLSAGAEQDSWIRTLFASPIERSITPAFDLPPQGAIELSGMAMMPKEMVSVMTVQDRVLFVPVLAINLLYGWEGGEGQTATSHVVGIDRGAGAKMAPFRIDTAPRMQEGVTSLAYTVSVRR
jgi:hypothetical protein